jgi:hypothetical protein
MRIVYHLGAHFTDEERLLKCLLKNRDLLAKHDIVVPGPKSYRNLLRDTVIQLKGNSASRDTQALILDKIMEADVADRMVLSWDSFLSLAPWALDRTLYPAAGERVRAFTQIFPEIEAEFHLSIRNPATLLPMLLAKMPEKTYAQFIGKANIFDLHWSRVIEQIMTMNPDVLLTVWCDEDTPLIWPEVLHAVAGLPEDVILEGEDDLLSTLMSGEGMTRLQSYLQSHPPGSVMQRRKIVSAFLDKFALPDRMTTEIEMEGWTEETVAQLTRNYNEDVARIAAMPGVDFISP